MSSLGSSDDDFVRLPRGTPSRWTTADRRVVVCVCVSFVVVVCVCVCVCDLGELGVAPEVVVAVPLAAEHGDVERRLDAADKNKNKKKHTGRE